jgi:hypothetical protein
MTMKATFCFLFIALNEIDDQLVRRRKSGFKVVRDTMNGMNAQTALLIPSLFSTTKISAINFYFTFSVKVHFQTEL